MFVIGFSHKPKKMAENVDGFSVVLGPKYRVWGNFKHPLLMRIEKGCNPSLLSQFGVSVTPLIQFGG